MNNEVIVMKMIMKNEKWWKNNGVNDENNEIMKWNNDVNNRNEMKILMK